MRRVVLLLATMVMAVGLAIGHASGAGKTVKADNFDFKPGKVTIENGDKVTWKNVEGVHTVTFKNGSFDKEISGDDRVSKKFSREGTFRYLCTLHKAQGMRGKVIVE